LLGHPPALSAIYCHTPPRYLYDQKDHFHKRIPYVLRPLAAVLLRRLERGYRQALQRADIVFSNSRTIQGRLRNYVGVDSQIIFPPVRTDALRWIGPGDYYLSTGRLDPLKRVDRIIDAFLRMPNKRLIVVSGGCDEPRLRKLAGSAPNITFAGWVSDARLSMLLGNCIATVYIPVDEDFGISPVESMAAGKPVIGVREGGLCETILDGSTGWLLDPRLLTDGVIAAVGACTVERAAAMREACEQRSLLFTEEVFRINLLGALEQRATEKGLLGIRAPVEENRRSPPYSRGIGRDTPPGTGVWGARRSGRRYRPIPLPLQAREGPRSSAAFSPCN
jgi:glycosyltransferase involved in cell wall biosynthesis